MTQTPTAGCFRKALIKGAFVAGAMGAIGAQRPDRRYCIRAQRH